MKSRKHVELIKDIEDNFTKNVSGDARYTILTIKNLIESNSLVEDSIDQLHTSINKANRENEKLQKRIYVLTVVAVILAVIQAIAVVVQYL